MDKKFNNTFCSYVNENNAKISFQLLLNLHTDHILSQLLSGKKTDNCNISNHSHIISHISYCYFLNILILTISSLVVSCDLSHFVFCKSPTHSHRFICLWLDKFSGLCGHVHTVFDWHLTHSFVAPVAHLIDQSLQQIFWLIIARKAQVFLTTLTMALYYSSVSVSHDSVSGTDRTHDLIMLTASSLHGANLCCF